MVGVGDGAHESARSVILVGVISDAFPLDPPEDWFTTVPDWFKPNMKLSVITSGPSAGRVAGTVAQRGTFLVGAPDPWTSAPSPTGYHDAMQIDTVTSDGSIIRTAALAANVNHVPDDPMWTYGRAVDAMANTGAQLARVVYKDIPGYGTVALGAAWPGIDDLQVRKMQASALSGDWRWREEYRSYDMAGAIFVNNPGMPLPDRPVFTPFAVAASLSSPHPAIVGSWQEARMFCGSCGSPLAITTQPNGAQSVQPCLTCVARTAAAAPTPPAPAPSPSPDGMNTPADGPSIDDRVQALEERMDAVESWLTEDAMSDVEGMGMAAALPETAAATAYGVVEQDGKFCVVSSADGTVLDCYATADEANAQIDTLTAADAPGATPSPANI